MQIKDPDISDYFISYKGHGMLERASKTNSIAHVVAHENRHLSEFRNQARNHNKEIISENISIRYEFIDGKIVAVAGKATAMMRDKPEDEIELGIKAFGGSNIDLKVDALDEGDKNRKKLEAVLARVDTVLNRIGAKLDEAERVENKSVIDPNRIAELRRKKTLLEDKKKDIIKKRNMLNSEKLKEMAKDLFAGLIGLVDQASDLIKAIYGLESDQYIEQDSDNNNSGKDVSIPDYSMLFTGMLLDTIV